MKSLKIWTIYLDIRFQIQNILRCKSSKLPSLYLDLLHLRVPLIFLSTLAKKKYLDIYRLALTKTFFRLKFL